MLETLLQPNDTTERCGLILNNGTVVEIPNIDPAPEDGYYMDPEIVLPYIEQDEVAATWHTHPRSDPSLSEEDRAGFLAWPTWQHFVIGRRDNAVAITKYRVEQGAVIKCA